MRVTGLQFDMAWEDKRSNRRTVGRLVREYAGELGDLLVLPEMFTTGFTMNAAGVAEPVAGETERWLASLASEHGLCVIGGNVRVSGDGRYFNEAVAFTRDGELCCRYQKIHPFSLGEEDKHYAAGSDVKTFHTGEAIVAPLVCYDLRFPEVFRRASERGANLMVVIANWPAKRIEHWVTLLRARAIENLAYVIGVNRVGNDPSLAYTGRSIIVDYMGEIMADADDGQTLISADLDFKELNRWRESFPALRDRKF